MESLYDHESEEALIGALIVNPDEISRIDLEVTDIHDSICRTVFETMQQLHAQHQPIDYITLSDRLRTAGKLDDIGGQAGLTRLLTGEFSSMNSDAYADIIRNYAIRRAVLQKANELAKGAFDMQRPIDSTVGDFASSIPRLVRVRGGLQHVSIYVSRHYDRLNSGEPGRKFIPTGFVDFDAATYGGLCKGELLLLSGKPAMGKTKWMLQGGFQIGRAGYPVGIYECETPEDEVMDRELSRQARIPTERLASGKLQDGDWDTYTDAVEKTSHPDTKIYIDFTPSWTLAGLRADLARAKEIYGIEVFMFDYMKFITDHYGDNETERLNYISRELKIICRDYDVAGVVIHSLNKEGLKSGAPGMESLSQGADIPYDADKVLMVNEHIPEPGKGKIENWRTFTFAKSRRKLAAKFFHMEAVADYPDFRAVTRRMP